GVLAAAAAVHGVAAVAGVPDEDVVAVAHAGGVAAAAADDGIVAGAADQGVVAVVAVDREPDDVGLQSLGVDRVVAAESVDDERIGSEYGVLASNVDRGVQACDLDPAGVAGDVDAIVSLRAVDGDRVGGAVGVAVGAGEVDADLLEVGAGRVVDGDGVGPAQ